MESPDPPFFRKVDRWTYEGEDGWIVKWGWVSQAGHSSSAATKWLGGKTGWTDGDFTFAGDLDSGPEWNGLRNCAFSE